MAADRAPRRRRPGSLIWINGPFGAGKTTVARALVAARHGLRFYDPETVGIILMRARPRRWRPDDFQSLRVWQHLTALILLVRCAWASTPIVVPMTLVDPGPRERILGALRARGVCVREVWLSADAQTLASRLRDRGDPSGWPGRQLCRCLAFSATASGVSQVDAAGDVTTVRDAVLEVLAERT